MGSGQLDPAGRSAGPDKSLVAVKATIRLIGRVTDDYNNNRNQCHIGSIRRFSRPQQFLATD
jgi:hypothetical protein